MLILVEISLEFAPVNSVQVGHFARLELVVKHLEEAWKCKAKLVIVRTKTVPVLSGFVRPLFKLSE